MHPLGEIQIKFSVVDDRPIGMVSLYSDLVWSGRDGQAGEYQQSHIDTALYDMGFTILLKKSK